MLDWLVKTKSDKCFLWLRERLERRCRDAMNVIRTKPTDVATLVQREQALGLLEGLEAFDVEINEHVEQLMRKLKDA